METDEWRNFCPLKDESSKNYSKGFVNHQASAQTLIKTKKYKSILYFSFLYFNEFKVQIDWNNVVGVIINDRDNYINITDEGVSVTPTPPTPHSIQCIR